MQRTKIKVGMEVGVVPSTSGDARRFAVKATVEEVGATYDLKSWSRGAKIQKSDGIRVRFAEPMLPASYGAKRYYRAADRSPTGTPAEPIAEVVTTARCLVDEWSVLYEEQRIAREANEERQRAVDELAGVVEPLVEAIREALTERGITITENKFMSRSLGDFDVKLSADVKEGTEGKRVVGGDVEISFPVLAALLGLPVPDAIGVE